MTTCFIEPLDVLYLRGNHLFGDAGSHGAALMPPWPSVFAGAIRSHILSRTSTDLAAFAQGEVEHPVVGTPVQPRMTITGVQIARRTPKGDVERFFTLPADLVVLRDEVGKLCVYRLEAVALPELPGSRELERVPVLRAPAGKPAGGLLLRESGWTAYLAGRVPNAVDLIPTVELWQSDPRLGIALDASKRSAADGAIYTAEAVAMARDERTGIAGFAVSLAGVEEKNLGALLRLGGDGRGAALHPVSPSPPVPLPPVGEGSRRFKLVLTTSGIFEGGWRLPGLDDDNIWHGPGDCTAKLVCAAVARAETVSGWDLAARKPDRKPYANGAPKPAQKAAPTGSVYWFEDFQGDAAALGKLVETGLWGLPRQNDDSQRKAEGFNNVAIGLWQ